MKGQFHHCPLIWTFSSKGEYNLVNKIHERKLKIIHNDCENRFNGLWEINNEVTSHAKNNKKFIIEIYIYVNRLSNSITNKIFSKAYVEYNLRNYRELTSYRKIRSRYVLESVKYS